MSKGHIIPIARTTRATLPPARDLAAPPEGELVDRRGRRVRDLRISVTDRCNFRCVYCMPKEVFGDDYAFLPRQQLLSFEEIVRVAKIFVDQGVEKIRITGGEPLLRRHIENLIGQLAKLPVELTLTTNGSLLAKKARALKDAGLTRVTVSLDGIDDAVFKRMNDVDFAVGDVLDGIAAAAAAGLAPVKVNCVVKRGSNDDQILPLARHFRNSGHILRFIEYMDVGASNGWRMDEVLPSAEVIARIAAEFPLAAIDANYPGEVAERWRYTDGGGEIGVISSVTQAFCSSCTRIRLSTEGQLYTCLFARAGHDLRALLRHGAGDEALRREIAAVWRGRDDRYSEIRTAATALPERGKIEMSYIGG
ncbi:GTP 3',8-cyclase MoaA [Sulfuritalea hydrogenivorans]|uniref:GTP 3',8-cyclase n=1 Tax=Sulfuritalea hydrogenivorans sk43H TaxID=1223802 RepID=W0SFB5_9PROT|nr:GTP 3',8-cyclase MoaA [Sulfuritalea hydrogenivorans]BAO29949.1 molybdenum cofactor biosynthesis protein A [Sulfuritalea hydrogenivorans sk43H]